ncbi:hypothetical protein K435DRAFT_872651 [Dendrothele bispora CBS 962.96]|uniref:Uncharacterized protein n=2 Tax=Dendrothele bispora (strain CBS 962.96) TaxID=1314807 RepID=A0A4S8L1J1_DENBC|nr:hypothetical protein K435DRAFT_872651 [Dendrothele bispora CBS 962.96]
MSTSDIEIDPVLDISDVQALLYPLSDTRLAKLSKGANYVGTTDGPVANEKPLVTLKNATIELGADQAYYLSLGDQRLELSGSTRRHYYRVIFCTGGFFEKSQHRRHGMVCLSKAFRPGHWRQYEWSISAQPISEEDRVLAVNIFNAINEKFEVFAKSKDIKFKGNPNGPASSMFIFTKRSVLIPNTAVLDEWSISAQPISEEDRVLAVNIFNAINEKFEVFAKSKDIKFKGNPNGPASSMFIFTKRSVLIPNTAVLDEGRASDYPDPFSVLSRLGPEADMKFNRIPEVLLMDHAKKDTKPMSFHDLHLLGSSTVLQLIVSPRAYVYKGELGWDFRLICVKVLGKKDLAVALSPSKSVQKRRQVFLEDDDDDEIGHRNSRPRLSN